MFNYAAFLFLDHKYEIALV